MRKYQVYMRPGVGGIPVAGKVEVLAEDVELDNAGAGEACFWNFLDDVRDSDAVTVAVFPFPDVAYITSTEA